MSGRFDSDTAALMQRLETSSSSIYDLEQWIFEQIQLQPGISVLDLGCGTGKQIFKLNEVVHGDAEILGVDISQKAVQTVNDHAERDGLKNIRAVRCSLDDVVNQLKDSRFDLVLSSYAIYYSRDQVKLLSSFPSLLRSDGQVFICGYGKGTNNELYDLIEEIAPRPMQQPTRIDDFLSSSDIAKISEFFSSYKIVRLENKIIYSSSQQFLGWWKNHNSFIPELEETVRKRLDSFFDREDSFSLSKNVLGVVYER